MNAPTRFWVVLQTDDICAVVGGSLWTLEKRRKIST